jgi:multiple inositol-polyphosphate phosphatase/2,3-bisphosphoglycerate 3-phosphatase
MKKLIVLLLLLSGWCFTVSAQNCTADFLGTKTLYKDPKVKYTPAPQGYEPIFINHVGRHGARHLTKDVSTYFAWKLLMHADSVHVLTAQGEKLKQTVLVLDKIEKGNTKSISAEGRTELMGLGERMYNRYADVFKKQLNFNVAITKEIRTKQSADAFLTGLKSKLKDSASVNEYNDDTNLRFYDLSPNYKKFEKDGPWVKYSLALEKAVHLEAVDNALMSKLFTSNYLKTINTEDRKQFVGDIFGFATISYSVMEEAKQAGLEPSAIDFKEFFTCPQIDALQKIDLADDYYKKGPGIDNDGIQVRIAVPLLVNFIKTSDDFIKSGQFNARLRFAHAETISPIAALMEISTANKASKDINTLGKLWQASKVIPLSSNIQWIFYKKTGSNKYLVKILLNEKESHITGMHANTVYYDWDELRAFYMKKLKLLNVALDDDMKTYLAKVSEP